MKLRSLVILSLLLTIIGGCSTTRYTPAENNLKKKEYNQAIREYLRLLNPHIRGGKRYIYYDKEAITGIGIVYMHMQNYQTASKILHMVTKKDPAYGKAHFYLGLSQEALGDDDSATRAYRNYLSVDLSDPYRHVLISRLDYIVRRKIVRDIQLSLQNEMQIDISDLPEKSIAILYFLNLSEDPQWKPLQKGLTEMLITDLTQIGGLKVVERLYLNAVMDELRLSETGLIDEKLAPRLGKLMGVRNMVKGSYLIMPDLKTSLDANIFKADEALLSTPVDFEGTLQQLFKMEKNLVLQILEYLRIEVPIQQKEKILKIPTENMMAFMSYCLGLDAIDRMNYEEAQGHLAQAIQYDSRFNLARDLLISSKIWDAAHNQNIVRVDYEISQIIKTTSKGKSKMIYQPPPPLLSTSNRLQRMGIQQNAGFLPGNDTREFFQEAALHGAPVIPVQLVEPPLPPGMSK